MLTISSTDTASGRASEWRLLAACSAAYCIANVPGWVLPQYVFGLMQRYALGATLASLVPMVELLLIGGVAVALGARSLRASPRALVVGATLLALTANAVAASLPSVGAVLAARMVAGVAEAVVLYYSIALLAAVARPDRAYAIQNLANNVFGALLLTALPLLAPRATGLAYLPYSAVPIALLLPLLLLPRRLAAAAASDPAAAPVSAPTRPDGLATVTLAATILLVAVATYAHFAFAIPLGLRVALSESAVNMTLGIGGIVSIAGAIAALLVIRHFGRLRPLLVALALMLLADLFMVRAAQPALFRTGVILNMALMYFMPPLLLGYAAAADASGRSSGIVMGASVLACAMAPVIGGAINDYLGLDAFAGLAASSIALAAILLLLADRRVSRLTAPD
jgi:predicted MFS family arabinose efflux permease